MDKRTNARPRGRLIVPVDRDEDPARDLGGGYVDTKHGSPMCRADAGEPVFCEAELHCIVRLTSTKGSGLWLASFGERPVRVIVCH